jgi:hypothetical protein
MLNLIEKIFRQYSEAGLSTLDIEIKRNTAVYYRYEDELDQLNHDAYINGDCCADCRYGKYFSDLSNKYRNCGKNLVRLLQKRGKENDLKLTNSISIDIGG